MKEITSRPGRPMNTASTGPAIDILDRRTWSQSASILPGSDRDKERWRKGLKKNLSELVESELSQLLNARPLTLEEIQKVGSDIKKQQQKQKEKGDTPPQRAYTSHDIDSPKTQLALRLNAASKQIAKIRFSLVPSRLSELIFWDATIFLVQRTLEAYNAECQARLANEMGKESASSPTPTKSVALVQQEVAPKTESSQNVPRNSGLNGQYGEVPGLRELLALKDAEIAELKKKIAKLRRLCADGSSLPNNPKRRSHKGNWVLDQDSQEFLAFPEEVKENMRKEKQKRLHQVQQEMNFILDSENIEDTHGHWDCCGSTGYNRECTR